MRIRELLETKPTTSVGICFGRWNPPHKGHRAAWAEASSCDHWLVGTNESTNNKKNPLQYDVKVKCMEAVYPKIVGHVVPTKNIFELATKVYNKYGDNVDLKIYTDETWLAESLSKYNGVTSAHGYFKFNSINQVPTDRLSSGTSLREAVSTGDRARFTEAAGISADTLIKIGENHVKFFDLISKYLKQYQS